MTDPKSPESFQVRVYYEDTDAGGVVFYANYLKFLERARTEWLRDLGINQSGLAVSEQRLFVVKALDMAYRKPARLDDLLPYAAESHDWAALRYTSRSARNATGNCLPKATSKSAVSMLKCGRRNCRPTYAPNWDQFRNNHASHQRHVVAFADFARQRAGPADHADAPGHLDHVLTYIFAKRLAIKRADSQTRRFEDDFWSGGDLSMLQQAVASRRDEQAPWPASSTPA